ncbi:MAG: PAS domain S-box protein [Candidatus Eisenbacteria bacterium]|uniref:histidine kinase n=1 Tax=Eiseniibacteriota bacterium TaxID=2212470 RepID=A0A538U0W3_UNCEI|nr:MAG: PAS domain S-box protein [Candidatus Eisenbacteria bacterium]
MNLPLGILRRLPVWARFVASASLVGLMMLLRWPLEPFLHGAAPYAFFYLPVLVSAWYWGLWPSMLTATISALVALYVMPPLPGALASLLPFGLTCAAMITLASSARAIRSREERANAYLAAIVQSSDDAILSMDLDGIIRSCNRACEEMFGYAESELMGRPITVLVPPDLHAQAADIVARLRRGEKVETFETVRVTKDGRVIEVALAISSVRGENGEIIGVSKTARDITEIKRAGRALAAQQEWFRVTLASIGDAVIATDAEGGVTFLNGATEQLTGWSQAEAIGRPLADVFHIVNEQTRQPVEHSTGKVLRTGLVVGIANHTLLIGKDGAEFPIADSAAPIRDDAGKILGVVLVFHDVSEQRRAQAAIAEQREWLARTLTGWNAEEAVGRPCEQVFRIVNEQTRQSVENPVKRVLDVGTIVGLANHTVLISRDGSQRPIDDSGAPIRNLDGRIVGVVLVFRDVSERRRIETERHAAAVERERLLESERLARAESDRANRVKDDFMSMVSHELRTPLNAIVGWTELLQKAPPSEEMKRRGLEVIGRNARLQAQLISDLLDVSRIVSGKLLLEFQNVDLAAVIESAIETVEMTADAKGVRIEKRLGRDRITAITAGDPARLQQAVWNLLSNAIKFTPQGGTITVELKRADDKIEISVTDTGLGIRPDLLSRIFDRFYQRDAPTTRRHGGLGLGLSRRRCRRRQARGRQRRPSSTIGCATCACWWWRTRPTRAIWSAGSWSRTARRSPPRST